MRSREERGGVGLGILAGIAAIIGVILLVITLTVGVFAWDWFAAPYQGKLEARQQINSGDFRIQAYDHFYNLCASIQTSEAAIDATQTQIQTNTDPSDLPRLQTNLNGQTVALADAVNTYNADARKGYTEGQFRSSDLPYQVSNDYQTGEHTSCGR